MPIGGRLGRNRKRDGSRTCAVVHCRGIEVSRGLCRTHYQRVFSVPSKRWTDRGFGAFVIPIRELGRPQEQLLAEQRKAVREYHRRNRDVLNARKKIKRQELRDLVLDKYGKFCQCCGEDDIRFLAIDHIHGNGNKHRREIGQGTYRVYTWLVKNNFPPGFQVLCHNCNLAKGFYGVCPHTNFRIAEACNAQLGTLAL
mgnify:CR=1 FL=1